VTKDLSGTKTNPREEMIHSFSVRAFNIVSAVVKVFDTTTTAQLLDEKYGNLQQIFISHIQIMNIEVR